MRNMKMASFLLMVVIGCVMVQSTSGLIHVVGGAYGWDAPMNPTFFADWAAPRIFGVGDELLFPYSPGSHDLHQVSREDFDKCTQRVVFNQWILGPTRIPLKTPGDYYFICGVGLHCEFGQKLHIVVGLKPGSDGINWAAKTHPRPHPHGLPHGLPHPIPHHARKMLTNGVEVTIPLN